MVALLWIGASGTLRGPPLVAQELPDTVDVAVLEDWPPHYDILGDAESAVELLEERDDLTAILTDLVLPGMSGRELADRIRATRPELPLLVMSGYAGDPPGHPGDLPVDIPFIQKPFTPESLVHAIQQAL